MIILDNDYEIKEVEPLKVFLDSQATIYRIINGLTYDFSYLRDDIVQECALIFFKSVIKHYDYRKGVIIGKYLKVCYRNQIQKFLWRESRHLYSKIDADITDRIFAIDMHNWNVENMEFSKLLTKEQKQILKLILAGHKYAEICNIVCPNNKTKDKARPIYRRVAVIKNKLARFYGVDYKMPDHSGNRLRSEKAYQKYLKAG